METITEGAVPVCVTCGDPVDGSGLLCWRCLFEEPGKFTWPRVVCKNCGRDVAVIPSGWTIFHTAEGEAHDKYGQPAQGCERYLVESTDPTLRAPRQLAIDRRKILAERRAAARDEYPELI